MPLPSFTKYLVEKRLSTYCEKRIPEHAKDQVKLIFKIRGNNVTLLEQRPSFPAQDVWVDIPIAQFRFDTDKNRWTLYWADRNEKWQRYNELKPRQNFEEILKEIEEDPYRVFWG